MRKDYMVVEAKSAAQGEAAFVADHWTNVWRQEGGPKAATSRVLRQEEFRIMQRYLPRLPQGARLLDGGCGLGEWTAYFTRQGYPTVGLDLSAETIAQLRIVFPDQEFHVGDIRDTGFADDTFDGYFSWGTFEHFEDGIDGCVREAWRILKPGGYLFVRIPFDNLRHAFAAAFARSVAAKHDSVSTRFYQWRFTRGELQQALTRNGFEVAEIRLVAKRQGVLRFLSVNFGLHWSWKFSRYLAGAIAPFVWSGLIAHNVMAVARKPQVS
ncbi:MAG: class I SAM-dependent methyltransferase [Rhodospirillales bacterium]|nr:class I SAM-dependent methyltransferase [Rhodospirillales bacterium]